MEAARRRRVEAMGLGPVWVRRASGQPVVEPEAGDTRVIRIAALDWQGLVDDVPTCTACDLSRSRTQTVFGVGVERPDWLVLGEAPGAEEDALGEPFAGQAGKLLDAMLAAVGFSRGRDVFIANLLKCRPPGNRDPSPSEIAACRPYLERQIALLAPRMVLVVGKMASSALLGGDQPMSKLRGQRHAITVAGREVPVVATYHPVDLLRSADEKAKAWADLCFARDVFESIAPTSP